MNPKIEKINAETDKLRGKMSSIQTRIRELERQKTELENADIISAVRGIDIAPDELAALVRMFKEQQNSIVPDLGTGNKAVADNPDSAKNKKEDEKVEN